MARSTVINYAGMNVSQERQSQEPSYISPYAGSDITTLSDEKIGISARLMTRAIDPWVQKLVDIILKVSIENGSVRRLRPPPCSDLGFSTSIAVSLSSRGEKVSSRRVWYDRGISSSALSSHESMETPDGTSIVRSPVRLARLKALVLVQSNSRATVHTRGQTRVHYYALTESPTHKQSDFPPQNFEAN